jgi:hypothetical protein
MAIIAVVIASSRTVMEISLNEIGILNLVFIYVLVGFLSDLNNLFLEMKAKVEADTLDQRIDLTES